jgi:hypothetical protein
MKSFSEQSRRRRSKSTNASRMSRSGLRFKGLSSERESTWLRLSVALKAGDHSRPCRPASPSRKPRLDRAQAAGRGDSFPELGQHPARALAPTLGEPVGQHGGVHGAGAGPAHAFNADPIFLQETVQDTPGERPVRAPTLEGETHDLSASSLHSTLPARWVALSRADIGKQGAWRSAGPGTGLGGAAPRAIARGDKSVDPADATHVSVGFGRVPDGGIPRGVTPQVVVEHCRTLRSGRRHPAWHTCCP